MTPDFNDEKMLRTRFRQETFSVIICNIALLTVILSPGGDFSMTARIGFALGLVLLDAIYAVMRVRFRGNPNALKENRTYRTLYYVSWIMVGIAILLVIFHSLGYFRKKVSFSLIRLDFSAEAAEGFDAPAHGADEAWASQLKLVESGSTYLAWIDCHELGLYGTDLLRFVEDEAGLWLDCGDMFGKDGDGFIRINIATQRAYLARALDQLVTAVERIRH